MRRVIRIATGIVMPLAFLPARAEPQKAQMICPSAKKLMQNLDLGAAMKAVFGATRFAQTGEGECLYPFKLMRFADADVLITIGNEPGESCHGCAAQMSAYALKRLPEGYRTVGRFPDFGEAGTFGNPGRMDPIHLGDDDAIAVESGGTFQGFTSVSVDFYVFNSGKLVHLTPSLPLSADNSGYHTDAQKAVSVSGVWSSLSPKEIAVDYRVRAKGATSGTRAVWEVRGSELVPKTGQVPPEFKEASGG